MENDTIPSIFEEIANERAQFTYATTGQRFANYLVDLAVAYIYNGLIAFIVAMCMAFAGMNADDIKELFANKLFLYAVTLFNMLTAYTLIEGLSKGRSLGKLITSTQAVAEEDLAPISFKDAFIRSLCRFIPFEPFSALGGFPWHDKFSKTIVIKKVQPLL